MENHIENIKAELAKVNINDVRISEFVAQCATLSINGLEDKEGYKAVREARIKARDMRIKIENKRKELKEDSLVYGRAVDAEAKRLKALIEPTEQTLLSMEEKIDAEVERIKKEAEEKKEAEVQARVNKLLSCGATFDGLFYRLGELKVSLSEVTNIVENEFEKTVIEFQSVGEKIEQERLKKEMEEFNAQQEAIRIAKEQELARQKVAEEQEAERQRLAKIAEEQAAKEEALRVERQQIEDEKKRLAEEAAAIEAKKEAETEVPVAPIVESEDGEGRITLETTLQTIKETLEGLSKATGLDREYISVNMNVDEEGKLVWLKLPFITRN